MAKSTRKKPKAKLKPPSTPAPDEGRQAEDRLRNPNPLLPISPAVRNPADTDYPGSDM